VILSTMQKAGMLAVGWGLSLVMYVCIRVLRDPE
jgi:hypothetical protein